MDNSTTSLIFKLGAIQGFILAFSLLFKKASPGFRNQDDNSVFSCYIIFRKFVHVAKSYADNILLVRKYVKKILKILLILAGAITAILLFLVLCITLIKVYKSNASKISSKTGIQEDMFVNINGDSQWIYLREENRENPDVRRLPRV